MKTKAYLLVVAVLLSSFGVFAQVKDKYVKEGDFVRVTRYFEEGAVQETGTFLNGKLHGKWTEFYASGNVKTEAYFNEGKKEGTWFVYSKDGGELYEVVYADGKIKESHQWKIEKRNLLAEK